MVVVADLRDGGLLVARNPPGPKKYFDDFQIRLNSNSSLVKGPKV